MQIKVDDVVIMELTPLCCLIIQNDTSSDIFHDDLVRRLQYIITHRRDQCQERIIKEWMPILAQENEMLPSNKDALCQIIFAHPDYKDIKTRYDEQLEGV